VSGVAITPAVSVDAVAVVRHSENIRFAGHSYGEAEQKLHVAAAPAGLFFARS
jgi:hypothetical protein